MGKRYANVWWKVKIKLGAIDGLNQQSQEVFWGRTRTNTGREMNRRSNKIEGKSIVLGCDAFTCMKLPLFQNVSYGTQSVFKVVDKISGAFMHLPKIQKYKNLSKD
mgnify:CR=1 FL=1